MPTQREITTILNDSPVRGTVRSDGDTLRILELRPTGLRARLYAEADSPPTLRDLMRVAQAADRNLVTLRRRCAIVAGSAIQRINRVSDLACEIAAFIPQPTSFAGSYLYQRRTTALGGLAESMVVEARDQACDELRLSLEQMLAEPLETELLRGPWRSLFCSTLMSNLLGDRLATEVFGEVGSTQDRL